MSKQYVALVGLNYPAPDGGELRAEAGDVVADLPPASVEAFLADGVIEPALAKKAAKPAAKEE